MNWSQALGVYAPTLGWSGICPRNSSSLALKISTPQFFKFLKLAGSELNNFGPWTCRDCSLRVFMLSLEDLINWGTKHSRLLLLDTLSSIPQLGVRPSKIFQTAAKLAGRPKKPQTKDKSCGININNLQLTQIINVSVSHRKESSPEMEALYLE